ncbi:deoxyribonuclease IV [Aureliella helgolandensis]|uniref:Probable endonuclease 4 n=1 Tax=Aureliella helgolandensis TaxID=2527968 RepID=A0A518G9R1_9BACT|nr:deoxyribonuclease IV [Aureliella helgolandensis]QDV25337.1 Endonuclease 4 [Aureliella helgolandensis]
MAYRFGSHTSVAGGLYLGVERAHAVGCDVVQIFTKNNNQWKCKPLSDEDCAKFRAALAEHKIGAPIAHSSYLINVASPDDELWEKSLEALVVEWQRCEQLELEGLVMHPGAFTKSSPEQGQLRIVDAVQQAIQRVAPKHCKLLFENTAGQGSCLGWQIEQLGFLLAEVGTDHTGVCWDTCHALAAGYDFRTAKGLREMIAELETHDVLPHIAAVHINDSKKDCGTRVDRHEHIGRGFIGEAAFQRFLRSTAFKSLPMYLETPKGTDEESGEDWDMLNLALLRRLAGLKGTTTVAS